MRSYDVAARQDAMFVDRSDAGRRLAAAVLAAGPIDRPVVLGLPRGGVPVAVEVAAALGAPLEVIVVRKLGIPSAPEVAMGAIGEGGVRLVDEGTVLRAGVTAAQLAEVERRERHALEARVMRFRGGAAAPDLVDRTAVIVDDGIATGATASAACAVARRLGAARVILAAPVGSESAIRSIRGADEVVCPSRPAPFGSVGRYYVDFDQTEDEEVVRLLDRASGRGRS